MLSLLLLLLLSLLVLVFLLFLFLFIAWIVCLPSSLHCLARLGPGGGMLASSAPAASGAPSATSASAADSAQRTFAVVSGGVVGQGDGAATARAQPQFRPRASSGPSAVFGHVRESREGCGGPGLFAHGKQAALTHGVSSRSCCCARSMHASLCPCSVHQPSARLRWRLCHLRQAHRR